MFFFCFFLECVWGWGGGGAKLVDFIVLKLKIGGAIFFFFSFAHVFNCHLELEKWPPFSTLLYSICNNKSDFGGLFFRWGYNIWLFFFFFFFFATKYMTHNLVVYNCYILRFLLKFIPRIEIFNNFICLIIFQVWLAARKILMDTNLYLKRLGRFKPHASFA